jgi:hypothetical protein
VDNSNDMVAQSQVFRALILQGERQQSCIQPILRDGFHIKTAKSLDTPISDFIVDHHCLVAYLSHVHYHSHSSLLGYPGHWQVLLIATRSRVFI